MEKENAIDKSDAWNPVFDVTPNTLVHVIINEDGLDVVKQTA